jgi:hypothetical protein
MRSEAACKAYADAWRKTQSKKTKRDEVDTQPVEQHDDDDDDTSS